MSLNAHNLVLKPTGELWSWGYNLYGGLGVGTVTTPVSSPVLVLGSHTFTNVSAGSAHSLGRKSDGNVWSWGVSNVGQLGTGDMSYQSSPVLVIGNHSFVKVSTGQNHCLALKSSGEIWVWGWNNYGQLGINNIVDYSSPVLVLGSHSFVEVVGSYTFSLARKANGQVWSWGDNSVGQLGVGNRTSISSPVLVVGSHSFVEITASRYHSLARKANGQVWSWGSSSYGQLGANNRTSISSPVLVVGSHSFVEISAGLDFSIARKANGEVWSWGINSSGNLGANNTTSRSSPILVVGSHSFVEINAGQIHTLARKSDGSVWSWGNNSNGQLGTGNLTNYSSPVLVVGSHVFIGLEEMPTPPVLTAAVGATVDGAFNITFTDNPTWRNFITSITIDGTTLVGGYSVAAGAITFTPSASNPTGLLQTSGTKSFVVTATGFIPTTTSVNQTIGVGADAKLIMKTQPTSPATNGAVLGTQPAVYIQDQYGNATTSIVNVTAAVGAGTWTLGGTKIKAGISGTATYTNLTATSFYPVNGATITFTSGALTLATSNTFNISGYEVYSNPFNIPEPITTSIKAISTVAQASISRIGGVTNADLNKFGGVANK